ncbi:hypothetical protein [Vibrio splendidus]|nr:hypothetical protein [Vibrio splendidus]
MLQADKTILTGAKKYLVRLTSPSFRLYQGEKAGLVQSGFYLEII